MIVIRRFACLLYKMIYSLIQKFLYLDAVYKYLFQEEEFLPEILEFLPQRIPWFCILHAEHNITANTIYYKASMLYVAE